MKQTILTLVACVLSVGIADAQQPQQTPVAQSAITASASPKQETTNNGGRGRALGEVTAIDQSAGQLTLKTDQGETVAILLNEKSTFLRVPPGESTLEKAVQSTLAEIRVGDRVAARGQSSDNNKAIVARQLLIMSKVEIVREFERERQEWQRRGIAGIVTALDPEKREIALQVRGAEGVKQILVVAGDGVNFRRYASDSVRFSDARSSSFKDLQPGDLVRALGNKNAEQTRFDAEAIVSGAFKTVGGTVSAVNPATNEIKISQLGTQQPLTILVNPNSLLRRLPTPLAAALFPRGQSGGQPATVSATATQGTGAGNTAAGEGAENRPRSDGGEDLLEKLERLPALALDTVKPGEIIVVSGTRGADASRVTAILFLTGLDAVLAPPPQAAAQRGQRGNAAPVNVGLPPSALDFALGLP